MALILEVLEARGGGVRMRARLDTLPLRIGRALDNDLILDDAYVDARHAQITRAATGEVVIEDLASVNGVIVLGGGGRTPAVTLAPGTELRLGRTLLRVRDSAEPVPPALPDRVRDARVTARLVGTRRGQLGAAVVALAAIGFSGWIDSFERTAAEDAFALALGVGMIAATWAGIWAVAGRALVQRFRFCAHFALITLVILAVIVLATLTEWAEFLFPQSALPMFGTGVAGLLLLATLVVGHLGLATTMPARRRWQAAAAAVLMILALATTAAIIADDTFSDIPTFAGSVKAVRGNWVPTHSLAAFDDVTAQLQQEVDALLEK